MIRLENISKTYSNDKDDVFYALKNINIELDECGLVSILGPSGCGKSTLLNLLGGLDRPTDGKIYIDDKELTALKGKEIDIYKNQNIGFVFQNCFLIPQISIIDNIILPLKIRGIPEKECRLAAIDLLKKFDIEFLKNKRVNQLSGGQAQKICICRALISNPKIILADEPTGALDSKSSSEVMQALKDVSKNHLVIMVTHNEKLSKEYSIREIRLFDGEIIADNYLVKSEKVDNLKNENIVKKNHLSLFLTIKMALKNLFAKKWKSILTSISNSLGVIGIGFFFALNNGFNNYSNRISSENASSLPIVLSSYTRDNQKSDFSKYNASVAYTDEQEIYPSVSEITSYSYKTNNFSNKYYNYLNKLQDEGILREYITSYGSDYSFNLTTKLPDGIITSVDTSTTSYNYYANISSLPSNIFHVLYGDLDSYDLICGKMPTEKNEIVLVVNKYNAVSFNILKKLGFYNDAVKEDDVRTNDDKKVKPISFSDVVGKEYKIFSNDDYYYESEVVDEVDALNHTRQIKYFKQNDTSSLYESDKGIKLKISGIIRPKSTATINILSPALCYTKELQDEIIKDKDSSLSKSFLSSFVLDKNKNLNENGEVDFTKLTTDLLKLYTDYQAGTYSNFPISEYNKIIYEHFSFYVPYNQGYYYTSVNSFLSSSRVHCADIIKEDLLSNDKSYIEDKFNEIMSEFSTDNVEKMYEDVLNFTATLNAYSLIDCIVLFPTSLENRTVLLNRLDSYNVIDSSGTSSDHASSISEQITYSSENDSSMIESVAEAISLANVILLICAVISFVISILMSAFMISNNVLERQKEIGLLRGLGTSKISVSSIFVFESITLGLISGIIGAIVTFAFSFPLNAIIDSTYPSYKVGNICDFTFVHSLIVIMTSTLVSFIASFVPAFLAAKNDPIKSLRSE